MTDPGLDQRLRQRSRRSGFMIGVSMALTIAVCVAGFSVIYAALDDTIGDFVSRDVPAPEVQATSDSQDNQAAQEPAAGDDEPANDPPPNAEAPVAPTAEPTAETSTGDGEFNPDYQSSFEANLNFRSEPSTAGGGSTVVQTLPAGTLLEFTGNRQDSENPAADGEAGWLEFELEDGTRGWLRGIDVTTYDP